MATCSEKIEPVRCGCGGEAFVGEVHFWGKCYTVQCSECGIETKPHDTEAEAITAWNTAMGAGLRERLDYLETMFYTE